MEYVKTQNLETPFKNGCLSNDWYYCFMKRHPILSFKKPEQLQKFRYEARQLDIIYNFYPLLKRKGSVRRLKAWRFGEILTTQEILMKQKRTEELKASKKKEKWARVDPEIKKLAKKALMKTN